MNNMCLESVPPIDGHGPCDKRASALLDGQSFHIDRSQPAELGPRSGISPWTKLEASAENGLSD